MESIYEIVDYTKSFKSEEIPEKVIDKTKLLLLDSIAVIVHGNQQAKIKKLTNSMSSNDSASSPTDTGNVFGTDLSMDYQQLALVQGISMVTEELDEGNAIAKGHPLAHFLPGLLSFSFKKDLAGKKLLEAMIINYEVSARMGAATKLRKEIHPHGNWGVFGNGFGIGKLLDWDSDDKYVQAAMLSMSSSFPTLWHSVLEGHDSRNVLIGLNNFNTLLLPSLVNAGFSSSLKTPELLFKQVLGSDLAKFKVDFNERYILLESYFKFYAYCRFCHSAIDGVKQLITSEELDQVKEINVRTYQSAAELDSTSVSGEFAGKFSIPYAVTKVLYEEKNPAHDWNWEDEEISSFMKRVVVKEDEEYTARSSTERLTKVDVTFHDDTNRTVTLNRATGDPDEENLREMVIEKSRSLLNEQFNKDQTEEIIETVLNLENISSLKYLEELLIKK